MGDVFISHSKEDFAVADAARAALERAGVSCWIAPRDVEPGRPYAACIVRAISQCRVLLLVYSARANQSTMVMRELELAASNRKFILPMRIDDSPMGDEMKFFMGREHWLDASRLGMDAALGNLPVSVLGLLEATRPGRGENDTTRAGTGGGSQSPSGAGGGRGQPARATGRATTWLGAVAVIAVVSLAAAAVIVLKRPTPGTDPKPSPTAPAARPTSLASSPRAATPGVAPPVEPAPPTPGPSTTTSGGTPPVAEAPTVDPAATVEAVRSAIGLSQVQVRALANGVIEAVGDVLDQSEAESVAGVQTALALPGARLVTQVRVDPRAVERQIAAALRSAGMPDPDVRAEQDRNIGPVRRLVIRGRPGDLSEERVRAIAAGHVRNKGLVVLILSK